MMFSCLSAATSAGMVPRIAVRTASCRIFVGESSFIGVSTLWLHALVVWLCDQVIRKDPASRGTEKSADDLGCVILCGCVVCSRDRCRLCDLVCGCVVCVRDRVCVDI